MRSIGRSAPSLRAAVVLAFSGIGVASACGSGPIIKLCGEIPDGGCPIGRGGTCDDKTCAALYDCVDGSWKRLQACEQGAGGAGGDLATGSSVSSSTGCTPVSLDHSKEITGCTPDLESPDCPAAAAETCAPCETGCVDFFMCEDAGWTDVAFCDDSGKLVLVMP